MEYDGRLPAEGVEASDEQPLREFALLVGGLVAVAAAVIAVAAFAIDRLVPLLPPELEARWLGGWLDPGDGVDADPRTASVQALLDRLARHWPDHPYEFRVGLLAESEPNALALPGGAILVTSGLLEQAASENELALVLGHELGHYRGRDHLRGLGRGLVGELVVAALAGTGGGDAVAGLASLAGGLAERGFDRSQESRADAFGLSLVQAEYGHVAGAGDFFARLAASESGERSGARALATYLSTHPHSAFRAEQLRAEAAAHGWPTEGPLTPLVLPPPEAE
jgi:Zn-dependent protease with chaperone function